MFIVYISLLVTVFLPQFSVIIMSSDGIGRCYIKDPLKYLLFPTAVVSSQLNRICASLQGLIKTEDYTYIYVYIHIYT